ncbi:unnamed protein product [Diamesa serratosioi]
MEDSLLSPENTAWLENEVIYGFRLWHVMFMVFSVILFIVVLLCCCFRFRIPRTKQEIEADFQRRKIVKKFRKRIQKFENAEMDGEMDLKKAALEKIRSDFNKDINKSSDHSSESNDESNHDDDTVDFSKRTGAKKKKLHLVHKKDQLIQTIYTGNCFDNPEIPVVLDEGVI